MAHVETLRINGESNLGLMIYANNKFALVGKSTDEKSIKIIKDILGVPCYKVSIAGTHLIGVFLNGTPTNILVPEITYDKELAELNKIGKNHDVKFHVCLDSFPEDDLFSKDSALQILLGSDHIRTLELKRRALEDFDWVINLWDFKESSKTYNLLISEGYKAALNFLD